MTLFPYAFRPVFDVTPSIRTEFESILREIRRSFLAHSFPRRRRHLESTKYAAMDRTERIRERVRRRYIAASSRARLIRERDDCNGEISSKWTLNSNDSSPHSSLPLISTPGGLSRGHLGIRQCLISARFTSNFASTPSSATP